MSKRIAAAVFFAALLFALPALAEHLSINYTNNTPFELIEINAKLETTHAPRDTRSRVNLVSGSSYRIGVTGAIKPLSIKVEFAAGRLEFNDLSGLALSENMLLDVVYDDKGARLEQSANGASHTAQGKVVWFLSAENRSAAVPKDTILAAKSQDDVRRLFAKAAPEAAAPSGSEEPKNFDVEAGPIWNNNHAQERCPELLAEWNRNRKPGEPEARWTGQWATTREGEMSVCGFATGSSGAAASAAGALYEDQDGETLYFPVTWAGTAGVGLSQAMGGAGLGIALRLEADNTVLKAVFDDLVKQGLRPWRAEVSMQTMSDDKELFYGDSKKDAATDMAGLFAEIAPVRESKELRQTQCVLVGEAAFKEAAAGKEVDSAPGVMLMVGPGTVEAFFLPDCSSFLERP